MNEFIKWYRSFREANPEAAGEELADSAWAARGDDILASSLGTQNSSFFKEECMVIPMSAFDQEVSSDGVARPEYYNKGTSGTIYGDADPEVTCGHCKRTFRTDPMDATCRLCGKYFRDAPKAAAQDDDAFSSINETCVCPPACPVCGPKREAQDDYRPHHCKHGTRGVYCFDFHPSHEREKCDAARTVAHAELKVPTQNDNGYGHTGPCPPNCTCDMAKAIARTQDAHSTAKPTAMSKAQNAHHKGCSSRLGLCVPECPIRRTQQDDNLEGKPKQ